MQNFSMGKVDCGVGEWMKCGMLRWTEHVRVCVDDFMKKIDEDRIERRERPSEKWISRVNELREFAGGESDVQEMKARTVKVCDTFAMGC